MDTETAFTHKIRNLVHTWLLIGGMALLLALCAELLFGEGVWVVVFAGVAMAMAILPEVSPAWTLRIYRARPLSSLEAPQLNALIRELSQQAALDAAPRLYWIPSSMVNAFTVGNRDDAAIGLTDGILRVMTVRELAGVLAHEIGHVANNDMRIMVMADMVSRLTHFLSLLALFVAMMVFPFWVLGLAEISLLAVLLLVVAPSLSGLLQLALSRVREFDADLEAARLTGDPEGLASALLKLERRQGSWWQRLLYPGYRAPEPSLLRTHPNTEERVKRLLELRGVYGTRMAPMRTFFADEPPLSSTNPVERAPRHWIMFGVWR